MLNVLFSAQPERWAEYEAPLNAAFAAAGLDVDLSCDHAPDQTDYIVFAPNGPVRDFSPYTRTKAIMSLWAGVETVVDNQTLTQPLCRMVTILGIGALGAACGQALHGLGFPVTGWSRSPKDVPNIHCLHGDAGLQEALTGAEIVVLLLPQTPQTNNILNAQTLDLLAKGAFIINPGRGPLIDDDALLAALDLGQIAHATLDVFRVEPLPKDHPFWAHPQVTVTPHIASTTRPETASEVIAANIARGEAGEDFLHLVDRSVGY
jgi:glyoxylate/hydroxypyruvate reductase A